MYLVAGLDLAAGRGVSELTYLRIEDGEQPFFDVVAHAPVVSDDAIVGELARRPPRVLAIDAPLTLPRAVMSALLPGRAAVEGAPSASPYTRAAERDPMWSTLGVRPFPVSFLGGLTFRAILLVARLRATLPGIQLVETFPTAVFRALRLTEPQTGKRRSPKQSTEARVALQLWLQTVILGIPSPDATLLGADLLDAFGAAIAALAYTTGEYVAVGDPEEGQIILPRLPSVEGCVC